MNEEINPIMNLPSDRLLADLAQVLSKLGQFQQPSSAKGWHAIEPHGSGSVGDTWSAWFGDQRLFVKQMHSLEGANLFAEAHNLERLADGSLITPEVVWWGELGDDALLVLTFLEISSQGDWSGFGRQLAQLHREHTRSAYGWEQDNFIGLGKQPNGWYESWATFFAEQRIGYQAELACQRGWLSVPVPMIKMRLLEDLDGHQPAASLLHGDLWSGNVGFVQSKPCLYDPACYYGDRETDLAMAKLFGGFPEEFFQAYQAAWPLDSGHERRLPWYQLYHLLNHGNLFAGSYIDQAQRLINQLLA